MTRRRDHAVRTVVLGVLLALLAAPFTAQTATAAPIAVADGKSSTVMVLDSSGSMADDDGSGSTRIESARRAVGTVVDSLPDGHPTGLRLYGSDQQSGCQDTRLARPVRPLDRGAIKQAVAEVEPKGDTPIGLSLRKAAEDLPEPTDGSLGRRTILLISDGEDNCGAPPPCEVAQQLGESGIDLRIDAIGFQVNAKAREQLQCVAEAGHGSYYDAPDADALARELQRAARLSADGYRFKGKPITGGSEQSSATDLLPGQYLDSIGPGETRWYAADLDAATTATFSATAVPQPGVPVESSDGLSVRIGTSGEYPTRCESGEDTFGQEEGAMPLTAAVSRIPSADGGESCDSAGRYLMAVSRESAEESDQARWPVELTFALEEPLPESVTPAQSEPDYGAGGKDAQLPGGAPKAVTGGTGFNDATELGSGVWKDQVLPAQTRWFRVPVGWGQQLRYRVEIGNEPTQNSENEASSFVNTVAYTPDRDPIGPPSELTRDTSYVGDPTVVEHGTVPVAWTNRWESDGDVVSVRQKGSYYIGVSLGPGAAEIAENAALGMVLRVQVIGEEKAGPQHNAPPLVSEQRGTEGATTDSADADSAGWSGAWVAALAGGAGAVLLAGLAVAYLRVRRTRARETANMTRGGW